MRMIFGVLALLVVLAIVGTVGKKQLDAVSGIGTRVKSAIAEPQTNTRSRSGDGGIVSVPGGMPAATPAAPLDTTVSGQARQVQSDILNASNRALQQRSDTLRRAEP